MNTYDKKSFIGKKYKKFKDSEREEKFIRFI
jgi:hypothetical protein